MENIEDIIIDDILKESDNKDFTSCRKNILDDFNVLSFIGLYGGEQSVQEVINNINLESLFIIKDYWKQEDAIEILSKILINIVANY
ncbi:MAG: hypothetical protein RR192_00145 [Peptostreptococcaceae bacterium]